MKVILLPKFYGHCPGLKRSLKIADDLILEAEKNGKKIYYDVPLAHNEEVEKKLQKGGFQEVNIEEVTDAKGQYFLISAHGVSGQKIEKLKKKNFVVKSAVCPTVKHVQQIAQNDYVDGYQIVIFGKSTHPEIIGVNGSVDDSATIVADVDEGFKIKLNKKTSVICQTTLSSDKYDEFVENLKKANPKTKIVARNTICPIVEGRVQMCAAHVVEEKPDIVVVVGSKTSSNTKQLASKLAKLVPTMLVGSEKELEKSDFEKNTTVLVVSGTSAPPEEVERIAEKLRTF